MTERRELDGTKSSLMRLRTTLGAHVIHKSAPMTNHWAEMKLADSGGHFAFDRSESDHLYQRSSRSLTFEEVEPS